MPKPPLDKIYFISDLHLKSPDSEVFKLFSKFILEEVTGSQALYLLGDIFDVWLGDDIESPIAKATIQLLSNLSTAGTQIYLIHGNRDFLIGSKFCTAIGGYLLDDPSVISLYGVPTLLCHGDILCWDDKGYQFLKKWLRHHWTKKFFLRLPLSWRKKIASQLRKGSKKYQAHRELAKLDATTQAINTTFNEYKVDCIIHGHTHRPQHQILSLGGQTKHRYVLGDWHAHSAKILKITPSTSELINFAAQSQT